MSVKPSFWTALAVVTIPKVGPVEGLVIGGSLFALAVLIVWLAWTRRIYWP